MKFYIQHSNTDSFREIVEKLVNAAGSHVLLEKPDLDKELKSQIVGAVQHGMSITLDTLLTGSSSVIVEFNIEEAFSQTFENVSRMVQLEMNQPKSEE